MAGIESTGASLSIDYFLGKFYQNNRNVRKSSGRTDISSSELSYEDSRALRHAINALDNYSYSKEDNVANIKNVISAFADTYNNALSSTSGKEASSQLNRYGNSLKKLASEYKDELESVGISIDSKNGQLKVNSNLLSGKSIEQLKKVFSSKDSNLLKSTQTLAKRIHSIAETEIYTQMTGNGGKINISL